MGRIKVVVDKAELQACLELVEKEGPFKNRSELYKAMAETEWALKNFYTFSVMMLRVEEYGLTPKTPKGKRGNPNLAQIANASTTVRRPRSEKIAADPDFERWAKALRKDEFMKKHPTIVEAVINGSQSARSALQCIDCASGDKETIRYCTCIACPNLMFRPYKPNSGNEVEVTELKV